jgi:hypothetical protein
MKLARIISDGDVKQLKQIEEKLGDRVLDRIADVPQEAGTAVIPLALLGP